MLPTLQLSHSPTQPLDTCVYQTSCVICLTSSLHFLSLFLCFYFLSCRVVSELGARMQAGWRLLGVTCPICVVSYINITSHLSIYCPVNSSYTTNTVTFLTYMSLLCVSNFSLFLLLFCLSSFFIW